MNIKYIYFEVKYVVGAGPTEPNIENENVLLLEPKTNSSGFWGFTNVTERKNFDKPTFSIVEQTWINLELFNTTENLDEKLKSRVDEALKKIKNRWQKDQT